MAQPPLETVTETGYALQALLISRDDDLTRDLVSELGADTLVVANDLDAGTRKLGYLDCAVAIYDLDEVDDDNDILALKIAQPNLAIIVLCDKGRVSELLNSPVSEAVFRVMSRPPTSGQFILALRAAFQEHEQLKKRIADGEEIWTPINTGEQPGNSSPIRSRGRVAVAAALGALLFSAIVLYFIAGDPGDDTLHSEVSPITDAVGTIPGAQSSQVNEINSLLEYAQSAATSGQLIKPDDASAIDYYNQVLALDPFDGDALAGLNAVTDQLIERSYRFLAINDTTAASSDLDAVDAIRPTHSRLPEARAAVEQKIAELSPPESIPGAATLARQAELEALRLEAETRERARAVLADIDEAIESGNLISLQQGSAIRLINQAWNGPGLPSPLLVERAERIASLLVAEASYALENENLPLAEALSSQLANIPLSNIPGRQALDADIAEAIRIANAVVEPARRMRMVPPTYPRNASRRGIEGWVHLSFNITETGDVSDIRIVESTPDDTFDEAAAAAVSEWKYVPRTIDGEPTAEPMEVRLQFSL